MEDQEAKAEVAVVEEGMNIGLPEAPNPLAIYLDKDLFDQAQRSAVMLSKAGMVPDRFRDKPADCMIALDLANRWKMHPIMVMQKVFIVHGQPGIEAQLVVALVNRSGKYEGEIEYEYGDESAGATDKSYKVRAWAKRARDGKVVYGPWIDWALVKGEGWYSKNGSKWQTMPEQMFHYRAASWFANRHCPEIKMGMPTVDELHDMKRADVVKIEDAGSKAQDRAAALKDRLNGNAPPESGPEAETVERPIIPPATEGTTDEAAQMRPEPSREDNAPQTVGEHEDERQEALGVLHTALRDLGASDPEMDSYVWVKTGKTAMARLTREEAVHCFKGLGVFSSLKKFRSWLTVEKARKANGKPRPGTLFKE